MLQIDQTIISLHLIETFFCCDVTDCQGRCCVEGESGAPLDAGEPGEMEMCLPHVVPFMTDAGRKVVEQKGVYVRDADGEMVTPLVDGRECAFSFQEQGITLCAFERSFREGRISFPKPVSCHLYPVRITRYADFDAVNYHKWDICSGACRKGKKEKVPLYVFLREPLIRKFGGEWYDQLCYAATHLP